MMKSLKMLVKPLFRKAFSVGRNSVNLQLKNSPQVKINQRMLFNFYRYVISKGHQFPLSDTGYRVFSQFEEDGILLYIFAAIGIEHQTFVDIGAGDGINSNCANFALNFSWRGHFIDGNPANIERGNQYYITLPETCLYPPKFVQAFVQRENINELIRDNGFAGG